MLPIVLYTGESRWTAAVRIIDLVTPGAPAPGSGASGAKWRSAPVFESDAPEEMLRRVSSLRSADGSGGR